MSYEVLDENEALLDDSPETLLALAMQHAWEARRLVNQFSSVGPNSFMLNAAQTHAQIASSLAEIASAVKGAL